MPDLTSQPDADCAGNERNCRIASALHDHVVHELFTIGIALQSLASGAIDPKLRARLLAYADSLDVEIARVRSIIVELRTEPDESDVRLDLDVRSGAARAWHV